MNEAITTAIVELARYAVMAYAVKNGRDVLIHWLDSMPQALSETQIIDAARSRGFELVEGVRQ